MFKINHYDKLSDFIEIYNPSDIYFIHNIDDPKQLKNIINYANIKTIKTTYINLNDPPLLYKDTIKHYDQEIYIKDIIEHFFKPSNSLCNKSSMFSA